MYNGNVGKKRRIDTLNIIPRPMLLSIINKIDTPTKSRDKALLSFIYMTGARVSEIVGTTKKSRKYQREEEEKVLVKEEDYKVEPLKKENIEINEGDDIILVHNVICLKRRFENHRRTIPIIISQEKPFVTIIDVCHLALPFVKPSGKYP